MKRIFTIFMLCAFAGAYAQPVREDDRLKGNVKSLHETGYAAVYKSGEPDKGELLYDKSHQYDLKGYITESSMYDPVDRFKSKLVRKYIRVYDDGGNPIERRCYDGNGNLESISAWKYDDNGNRTEEIECYPNGRSKYKYTYKYDDCGNRTEWYCYGFDGSLDEKHTYKYDDNGYVIEENLYDPDDCLFSSHTWKYDEKGNRIEWNGCNIISRLNSKHSWKYTWIYDDNGNRIKWNGYESDGRLKYNYSWKYKYDLKGNWTESIYYNEAGIAISISEQTIEYYE
ncbi:MAG: hypothetical protein LBH72_00780 [Proteiniphilum sp.]|jgi:hypothetical protein|nr:hypothetical protein [Proteiniphilum sp.]